MKEDKITRKIILAIHSAITTESRPVSSGMWETSVPCVIEDSLALSLAFQAFIRGLHLDVYQSSIEGFVLDNGKVCIDEIWEEDRCALFEIPATFSGRLVEPFIWKSSTLNIYDYISQLEQKDLKERIPLSLMDRTAFRL